MSNAGKTMPSPFEDEPFGSEAPSWTDRAARLTTILMVGRLLTGAGDYLCRVRNLSSGGMLIEAEANVAAGQTVRVELRNLNVVEGRVVWTKPGRFGLQFAEPRDVAELLHVPEGKAAVRPRSPRLSARSRVLLWHCGRTTAPLLLDLSQSGCRLETAAPLPIGAEVKITIPGLPPRHAVLRRQGDGEAGLAFNDPLSFAELSAWQRDAAARFGTTS